MRNIGSGAQASQIRANRFEELYQSTYDDVYFFVLRRIGSVDAQARAEDVTNDTFLTTWHRLDAVPLDLDGARAWLFTTARNCLLHEQRRAARRGALAIQISEIPDASVGVSSPDDDAVQRADFAAAWRALSPTDQEAIALAAFEDLAGSQAAQVLGISLPAYRFRLHQARSNLRRLLAEPIVPHSQPASPPTASSSSPSSVAKNHQPIYWTTPKLATE